MVEIDPPRNDSESGGVPSLPEAFFRLLPLTPIESCVPKSVTEENTLTSSAQDTDSFYTDGGRPVDIVEIFFSRVSENLLEYTSVEGDEIRLKKTVEMTCQMCHGAKMRVCPQCKGSKYISRNIPCMRCDPSGMVSCVGCGGTGRILREI